MTDETARTVNDHTASDDPRALYGAPQHDADAAAGYRDAVYDAHDHDWTPAPPTDHTAAETPADD